LNLPLLEAKVFPSYILAITMFGFLSVLYLFEIHQASETVAFADYIGGSSDGWCFS